MKGKGNHLLLRGIRCLKESGHMLGYSDLLSRPSIEMNTIREPIIKKVRLRIVVNRAIEMKTIVRKS